MTYSKGDAFYYYRPDFRINSGNNTPGQNEIESNLARNSMLPNNEELSKNTLTSSSGSADLVCNFPKPHDDYPNGFTEKQVSISLAQYSSYFLRFRYYFQFYAKSISGGLSSSNTDNSGLRQIRSITRPTTVPTLRFQE